MPGINQLGGALVATAAPKAPSGSEVNANAVAQSNSANQTVATDAVKGPTKATGLQEQKNDEGADRIRRERRSFQDLVRPRDGGTESADPVDVVRIRDAEDAQESEDIADDRDQVNLSGTEQASALETQLEKQSASKERLRAVFDDLFAPRPRVSAPLSPEDPAAENPSAE